MRANPTSSTTAQVRLLTAIAGSQTINFSGATLAAGQTCDISFDIVGLVAGRNISISSNIISSFSRREHDALWPGLAELSRSFRLRTSPTFHSRRHLWKTPLIREGPAISSSPSPTTAKPRLLPTSLFSDDLNAMLPGAVATNLPQEGGFIVNAHLRWSGLFSPRFFLAIS